MSLTSAVKMWDDFTYIYDGGVDPTWSLTYMDGTKEVAELWDGKVTIHNQELYDEAKVTDPYSCLTKS